LIFHFAIGERARVLDQAVGQGRFTVVDMGDNAEISNKFRVLQEKLRRIKDRGPPLCLKLCLAATEKTV
jgi:hypothetical protein